MLGKLGGARIRGQPHPEPRFSYRPHLCGIRQNVGARGLWKKDPFLRCQEEEQLFQPGSEEPSQGEISGAISAHPHLCREETPQFWDSLLQAGSEPSPEGASTNLLLAAGWFLLWGQGELRLASRCPAGRLPPGRPRVGSLWVSEVGRQ